MLKTMIRATVFAAACGLSFAALARADEAKRLEIPAGDLTAALQQLSQQSGVELIYQSDQVRGFRTDGVAGEMTAQDAVTKLLHGTPLLLKRDESGAMVIVAPGVGEATSLDLGGEVPRAGAYGKQVLAAEPVGSTVALAQVNESSPTRGLTGERQAEEEIQAAAAGQSNPTPTRLGEIVITAQKREERLQDVPISVTALTEQYLERLGADDLSDFFRSVPNMAFQPNVIGVPTIAIRGVASTVGSPTVGVYIDETPVQVYQRGFAGDSNPKVFDLDRIEVLRGPQGTLYGASSMGGTLRYITKQPSLTEFSGRLLAEVLTTDGGDQSWQAAAAAGGPIVENSVGFRGSIYYREDGGYIDNIERSTGELAGKNINDEETLALQGAVTAKLGASFDATLGVFYQEIERDDKPIYERPDGPLKQGFQPSQPGRDRFLLPSLKISGALGAVSLTSITSLFRRKNHELSDYSSLVTEFVLVPVLGSDYIGVESEGGAINDSQNEQRNFSQEIRFASDDPSARLQWVAGGFYQTAKLRFDQTLVDHGLEDLIQSAFGAGVEDVFGYPLLPGDVSYLGRERTDEEQLAGFGEVNFKLTPRVELVAGARLSKTETTTQEVADGILNGGPTPADAAAPKHQDETPVTPRLGINFRPNSNNLIYASVSQGFRSGGGNPPVPSGPCETDLAALGLSQAPTTYTSDDTENYELGYKGTLAAQRLSVSAAVFQIDWTDIQQSVYLPSCGFSFIGNLGEARSKGFELEVQSQPINGLFLSGALGYVDAKFVKSISLGTGPTLVTDGDQVPYTPEWSATAGIESRFQLAARPAYVRADYQYQDGLTRAVKRETVEADPFLYKQDSYSYVTARAGVALGQWDLAIFIENLLDREPVLMRSNSLMPVTNLRVREMTVRPRTIGLTVSKSF